MNATMIFQTVENGEFQWVICISNAPETMTFFAGSGADAQFANVQLFAEAMQDGQQTLIASIPDTLAGGPEFQGEEGAEALAQYLFSNSSSLSLNGMATYQPLLDDGESLWDEQFLEEAGERLMEAIAMM